MLGKILVVDDEQIIRGMLQAELEENYEVDTAPSAEDALEKCKGDTYDLVISDINMPGMKGYDLLGEIKNLYPKTKVALITAYNVDDYVRLAKQHGISNIIPKTAPFNFDELNILAKGLVTEDIFGIEKHMHEGFEMVKSYVLKSSEEMGPVEADILSSIKQFHEPKKFLRIQLEEAISNAVYHAPMDDEGKEKYIKHSKVTLLPEEYVNIYLARDDEKYGISVVDQSGMLSKEICLYKIDRNISAEGVLDEDGRGIHMTRLYSDQMIINIKAKTKTEVIMLNYFTEKYKGYKPLNINEL